MEQRERGATRPLPDFVVIGTMRAGTTSLYEWLRATGRVSVPDMKETDFFLTHDNYSRGQGWLRARYDDLDKPVGDISPNYTKRDIWPSVAKRLYQTNPSAKLIFIVRDPIARAISQYRMMAGMGLVPHGVDNFIDLDDGQHIVDTSRYAWQLEPYLKYWSIDDIHIVDFEDLKTDSLLTLDGVLSFVGAECTDKNLFFAETNTSKGVKALPAWWGKLRSSPIGAGMRARAPRGLIDWIKQLLSNPSREEPFKPISDDVKARLATILKSDTDKLRELTGRSFSNWSI